MESAVIIRLHRDPESGKCVLVLEGIWSKDKVHLMLPRQEAVCLALEAHGISDRCNLYAILGMCVERLGGAFSGVVIRTDESGEATAHLSLVKDGR